MTVRAILRTKGSAIVTVGPRDTLQAVAQLLKAHRIGAVVVVENGDRPIGIVSERDIVNALANFGKAALDKTADDVMSRNLLTCTHDDGIEKLLTLMTNRRVRHLPVVESGRLAGIISIGDLVKLKLDKATTEVGQLRDYVMGAT